MTIVSNNLIQLNMQKERFDINAETLLQQLGFVVTGRYDTTLSVTPPAGWTKETQGPFHTVFRGPNDEEIWSFIKYSEWDRHGFLQARGISQMKEGGK